MRSGWCAALSFAAALLAQGVLLAAPPVPAEQEEGGEADEDVALSASADGESAESTEGSPSEDASVVAPRVLSAPVIYPAGATGSATVLLELVIDRDGGVTSVDVLSGDEPFADAAAQAAAGWQFSAATRGGQAVPARIRFEVTYTPPAPLPVPHSSAPIQGVPALGAPPAPSVQVTEVQVFGEGTPGTLSLSSAEVRMIPGAFGDPFRAVGVMPGVGQLVTGLPVFFVRGAPPGNLGFLVDGVRVPLLFHSFFGPAVVHPKMIERIELHAGGYPASYGRYAGGVVDAELSRPAGHLNGEWSVRLVDSGAFVDVPFANGRGNAMLAGRYSYTALLLSLLSDISVEYWDYQALVSYDVSSRGTLSLFAFGAYDYLAIPPDEERGETVRDGENAVLFHRLDLRYDHRYGEHTKLRVAGTFGVEGTRGGQGLVRDMLGAGRLELRSQLSPALLLRAGASANVDRYELELDPNTENYLDVVELFPSRVDSVFGAYADVVIAAAPGISVTPGIRFDRYASAGNSALGVSPRLAANFRINEAVSIEHAVGIADQPPNFVPGVPGVAVAGLTGGLQRSVQTSAAVKAELPWDVSSSTGVFYNSYFNLTDPFGQNQDLDLDVEEARVRSTGAAMGLEVLLQRRLTRRMGGLLSYTLSRSTRSHERIHTLSGYDRPHVLNVGANFDLGRRWLASARSVFYSGVPGSRNFGERRIFDQSRARPFFRADVRLEKRFLLSDTAWWSFVAEVMNASFSQEVLRRPCEPRCSDDVVGPIVIPSLGVMGQF